MDKDADKKVHFLVSQEQITDTIVTWSNHIILLQALSLFCVVGSGLVVVKGTWKEEERVVVVSMRRTYDWTRIR